jgi:hypothetical protein
MGRDGADIDCQHRDKREPKPLPLRGPAFDGLIGGGVVSEFVARTCSVGPQLFAVVGGRTAELAEQVRATSLYRFFRPLRTESHTGCS